LNLFSHIKAAITTRQAAELYGLKVSRNGMTCCPFHPDRTPSMKVDTCFHCFGCGADGDVISFVAQMFHLRPIDAAKKLAEDFHIDINAYLKKPTDKKKHQAFMPYHPNEQVLAEKPAIIQQKADQKNLGAWIAHAQDVLIRYSFLLRDWKEQYAPRIEDTDWHPLFVEACCQETWMTHLIDLTYETGPPDKAAFFNLYETEVNKIEQRIADSQSNRPSAAAD
jgi:hypothetical protein